MESLYEELSLFDGDLLQPAADAWSNKHAGVAGACDVVGEEWLSPATVGDSNTLATNEAVLFPELLSPASPLEEIADGSVLETNWLDTQTNLLDFLVDAAVTSPQPVVEPPPATDNVPLVTDMSAISQHLNKFGYEMVNIPSPQNDGKAGEGLEMSLMEVVNNLAGALEDESSLIGGSIEQPHSLVVEPVLSPISVEEVENLLSSQPTSPSSSFDDSGFVDDINEDPPYSPGPIRESVDRTQTRSAPYHKRGPKAAPTDRKQRKKQQNKDAALRYRQKKKAESKDVEGEYVELETKNKELKDKVDGLTREIGYLKDLMTEVYKAKGMSLPSVLSSASF